jgi:3-hydroxymyristoyl/3-hydroxydecanoyl-(acyl carrier protein) dehydratase
LREGDLSVFGNHVPKAYPAGALTIPKGRLALLDNVPKISRDGGAYGKGFVRAEASIDPGAWFLTSHFKGDMVMPGTLMYDASLQAFRLFLFSLGWIPEAGKSGLFPALEAETFLKCRGQVTPATKKVAYDIHIKEISLRPQGALKPLNGETEPQAPVPFAAADCIMLADGRPIVEVRNLAISFSGMSLSELLARFRHTMQLPKSSKAEAPESPKPGATRPRATEEAHPGKPLFQRNPEPLPEVPLFRSVSDPAEKNPPPRKHDKRYFYDKAGIDCLIKGRVSDIFGPLFSRFDDGSFIARLPQAPYDFMDEVQVTRGLVGEVAVGSELSALFTPDLGQWPLSEASSNQGILPYPVLNEIALQPCGFLASFMGSALPFKGAMHFRNLGGQATVRKKIAKETLGPIATRAWLTKSSVLGATVIQHYAFECSMNGELVFDGTTHFGFLSQENLRKQEGLKSMAANIRPFEIPHRFTFLPYPEGPFWPKDKWRMLDEYAVEFYKKGKRAPTPDKPPAIWGRVAVEPTDWFFEAHFPFDPVWPGSLGLESFLQLAKVLAALRYFPDTSLEKPPKAFFGPQPGLLHNWLYRGQILPTAKECLLSLNLTGETRSDRAFSFQGMLWVDGLPIYHVENFTVALDAR